MKILVFDTETTGLPKRSKRNITEEMILQDPDILKDWPHIIQLSYIVFDTKTNKICYEYDHIVSLAKNVKISQGSIDIHGITRNYSNNNGLPIMRVLEIFDICLSECDIIVAHNLRFDRNMLLVEAYRNKIPSLILRLRDTIKVNHKLIHKKVLFKLILQLTKNYN